MNKKQLIAKLSGSLNLSKADAERTFDTITNTILDALKGDDTVKIAGFGTYKVVSDLPGVFVRESHPVIDDLILVIPFPDENAGTATRDADCFLAAENTEAGSGGGG